LKIRFLIANAYPSGGTVRTTINTANALAARGHKVEIISVYASRRKPAFHVSENVRLRPLDDRSQAGRAEALAAKGARARLVRAVKGVTERFPSRVIPRRDFRYPRFNIWTDIKLVRFLRSVNGGVIVGTRAGLNIAIARHVKADVVRVAQEHLHLGVYPQVLRDEIKATYPRLDAVVSLTSADAKAYRKLIGRRTKVLQMPNAVPKIADVRSTGHNKVVIAAGRLSRQKGFDRLLDAWAVVAEKHPDWELRIFGDGPLRDDLVQQIERLGVVKTVRLMGYTGRLAHEMADASIYAMASRFEGFPMVLLEAMKCGLPIATLDFRNGPRDLITPGVDGIIVTNHDTAALGAAINELIEDDDRRLAMGAAAVEKSRQFSIDRLAEEWEQIFKQLAAEKRAARRVR